MPPCNNCRGRRIVTFFAWIFDHTYDAEIHQPAEDGACLALLHAAPFCHIRDRAVIVTLAVVAEALNECEGCELGRA